MKKPVKNNVSWVGKVDWELLKFHGDDYSTHKGSTYNSYLIEEGLRNAWNPTEKAKEDAVNYGMKIAKA